MAKNSHKFNVPNTPASGRTIAKAMKGTNKGSQTPGKAKGDNCKADPIFKGIAKRNRSYKCADYIAWYLKKDGTKKGNTAFKLI